MSEITTGLIIGAVAGLAAVNVILLLVARQGDRVLSTLDVGEEP